MKQLYDVIIIGGGVVGGAAAREMSRYRPGIGVLERNLDVCYETSGRNSGMIHGGFAYDTGPLGAKLCMESNQFMRQLAEELDFKFIRCGRVLVDNTAEDMETLKRTIRQGGGNGVAGLELTGEERLHQLVPAVVEEFAMSSANSGIVDPSNYTIILVENVHANGATYYLDREVTGIRQDSEGNYILTTPKGEFHTRWVMNSVGLGCGNISDMLGIRGYRVVGPKGDYIILDRRIGYLLPIPVYPVPSNIYMGIHVTSTTDGDVVIGPNAEMIIDFTYYGVLQENTDYLAKSVSDLRPCIHKKDYIRNYSGILPKWVDEDGVIQDFKIGIRDDIAFRAINLVGIEFPGLTVAVPTACYAISLMEERERLMSNPEFNLVRKGIPHFTEMTREEQEQMIRQNSDCGQVICWCEKVTRAETLAATHSPLGVDTMTGVKYRTRSIMGRCQEEYCQMRIAQMIEDELGKKTTEVRYARKDSQMFPDRVREEAQEMEIDVFITDGGSAGLAAAVRLYKKGIYNISIVEREKQLGGTFRQCIHDGLGLICFKTTLSGPEYVQRFIEEVEELGIPYITDTIVLEVAEDRTVTAAARRGLKVWRAKPVILIMGCRERTRGALGIPDERPIGVLTAGVAQAYINLYNVMPAKEVIALGSGDIGMIMAHRLTLEGAHVQAVFEIQPYPSGLPRNMEQCLNDYGIPLYLNHTVMAVNGDNRLTGVTVSHVDEHLKPVPGTEKKYKCGTLILSAGLTPENELSLDADVTLDDRTKGAVMDEHFQADVAGIFVAGSMPHVHNLVDSASMEAESLADSAAEFVQKGCLPPCPIEIGTDSRVNHTVPQRVSGTRDFKLSLRVNSPLKEYRIEVRQDGVLVASKKMRKAIPAEMIELTVKADRLVSMGRLEVNTECQENIYVSSVPTDAM